jgi:aldehyde:ferredoxin oxidoreductase
MSYGYTGKILHVDLSLATMKIEEPPEAFYRTYMGGSALNLHYLLRDMPAGVDPLGWENILAISVGVTTGAPISGQSRVTVSAKSPLTGAIGDSQSGGYWPAKLKFAGFDGVIIRGKASRPVYLWIHDGEAELRDASHLWGRVTGESEDTIRAELNDQEVEILQIGPAGEKKVRFGAILSMCSRANGRTGMGAVMGSKNLKAIVVHGSKKPNLADPKALMELSRWGAKSLPTSAVGLFSKYGTPGIIAGQQAAGGLPSFNYNSGVFQDWEAIDGTTMYEKYLKGREEGKQDAHGRGSCFGCIIRCKRIVEIKEGPYCVDSRYGGPEYESICALGTYCGISDLGAIAKANEICNKYGMDTISCGATVAWAMETFERGGLHQRDTDGLDLRFGNAEAMVKLVERIGKREGVGDILAEGSLRASQRLGCGAEFLITSKGQEAPAHMPQVKRSYALTYAANPFGSDHTQNDDDPIYEQGYETFKHRLLLLGLDNPQPSQSLGPEKIRFILKTQYAYGMTDSLNLCQIACGTAFQLYGVEEIAKMVHAVTGWNVDISELLTLGERRLNMLRSFNVREGIDRRQDCLPEKFFKRELTGGPTGGLKLDRAQFQSGLDEYYRQSGWDLKTGAPTRQTLERLNLGWVADHLRL